MKKYALSTLFILAAGSLCWFGLPWWSLAVVGALSGWFSKQSAAASFGTGFLAGSMLWGALAGWLNWTNAGLLAEQIGATFQGLSAAELIWATAFVGGLLGGLGALTGAHARGIFNGTQEPR